jgi:hypothetical protein
MLTEIWPRARRQANDALLTLGEHVRLPEDCLTSRSRRWTTALFPAGRHRSGEDHAPAHPGPPLPAPSTRGSGASPPRMKLDAGPLERDRSPLPQRALVTHLH